MVITKYQHACLTVDDTGDYLVIDPGVLAKLPDVSGVKAVVVTHIHPDHLDIPNLKKLQQINPELTIYGSDEVISALADSSANKQTVKHGDTITCGNFTLEFFGEDHEIIYQKVPCKNLGVLVNSALYYPGDSYTVPEKPVEILAFPAAAPWLKVGEVIEFIKNVAPKTGFPTHNGTLSEFGESVNYFYVQQVMEEINCTFQYLNIGDQITA